MQTMFWSKELFSFRIDTRLPNEGLLRSRTLVDNVNVLLVCYYRKYKSSKDTDLVLQRII